MRPLGIPTVADRIAQEVARRYLEPRLEPVFHTDSYGYRPGCSAIDAVRTARQRCWRHDWVLDINVKATSTASGSFGTDQRITSGPAATTAAFKGRIHGCTRAFREKVRFFSLAPQAPSIHDPQETCAALNCC
jgi:hypothetical protein